MLMFVWDDENLRGRRRRPSQGRCTGRRGRVGELRWSWRDHRTVTYRSVDCIFEKGFELESYVAVVALVCAPFDLGGQSKCGGTGGQADDVVEGLHSDEILLECCGVGGSSRVFVGTVGVLVVGISSALAPVFIPFVCMHSRTA